MKNLLEALQSGYTLGNRTSHRGYISRKVDQNNQPIKRAGGSRAGQLYIELPRFDSSQYYYRQYLNAPAVQPVRKEG